MKLCKFPTNLRKMANAAGVSIERRIGGKWTIKGPDRKTVYVATTETEARQYLAGITGGTVKALDDSLPIPTLGTQVRGASPIPPQAQVDVATGRMKLAGLQLGAVFSRITPMIPLSQAIEKTGIGPAFSKVTNVLRPAMVKVDELMGHTIRPQLGKTPKGKGKTYQGALQGLHKRFIEIPQERQENIALLKEAFWKEDLFRVGVLLDSKEELVATGIQAAQLARLGVAHDIPMYVARVQLIDDVLKNKADAIQTLRVAAQEVQDGKLAQTALVDIKRMIESVSEEASVESLTASLGLSADELKGMELVRAMMDSGEVNIGAVYRIATAPKKNKAFTSARAQFAAEHNMPRLDIQLAGELEKVMRVAFDEHGVSFDRVVRNHMPIMRHFIDQGIYPGSDRFGLLDLLGEGSEVLTRRILSGHLNIYSLDPLKTAQNHIRNLILRAEYDPLVPEALEIIKGIQAKDDRLGNFLLDFVHELEGAPGKSFKTLNDAIRTSTRFMGVQLDDHFTTHLVNTLGKMAYMASIPFRGALIMRNYFQTLFFTAPVIGPQAWKHGLKYATGWENGKFSLATLKQAYNEAVRAGAIDVGAQPLHGSSEIFGLNTFNFADALGPKLGKVGYNIDQVFEMGFTLYRSADDWGRSVAFHGGRHRVNTKLPAYRRSLDLDQLVVDAKVKTFDETVELQFRELILAEQWSAAENLIGIELANKTHLLYGKASHPAGWGGVSGRLFGQFGTFPVQYGNYVIESLGRGTTRDKIEWAAVHGSLNAGIIWAGAEIFGADLESWATVPSLTYTGGPYAQLGLSVIQAMGGSDAERALARRNISMMLPTLEHPASIFLPGSYFIGDMQDMAQEDDFFRSIGEGLGVRFLRPSEDTSVHKAFGFISDLF